MIFQQLCNGYEGMLYVFSIVFLNCFLFLHFPVDKQSGREFPIHHEAIMVMAEG
jgi:hypothetical protein